MQAFRSKMDSLGGPAKNCRFAVRILPSGNNLLNSNGYGQFFGDLTYLCETAELPGRAFDFMETRYYGPEFQMPYQPRYAGQTDFVFLCRNQSFERQMFDDWMEIINPSQTFDFNYPTQYWSEIQVFQLSDYGDKDVSPGGGADSNMVADYQWTLFKAWPVQVHPQPVNWAEQDILRLQVTFSYRYWYRPGRDPQPSTGRLSFNG